MEKIFIKKILSLSLVSSMLLSVSYMILEPVVVSALSDSDAVEVTLTVDSGITISNGADVIMDPNLGISANKSTGASSWLVKTNHATGYSLAVKASSSPALVSGSNSFTDYTDTGDVPEAWSVATGDKEFGYSVFSSDTDTPDATWGDGSSCGTSGTIPTDLKYVGMKTTDNIIATRSTVTPVDGVTTNICFAAEQNGVYAASGVYKATITATATEI